MSRIWTVVAVAFVAGVVADLAVGEQLPGFIAAYSFVGCIVIILASKWLGKALLQQREDFYEAGHDA